MTVEPYFFVENQEDLHTKWMLTTAAHLDVIQTEMKKNQRELSVTVQWTRLIEIEKLLSCLPSPPSVCHIYTQSCFLNYFSSIIHTKNLSILRKKLLHDDGTFNWIKLLYVNLIFLSSASALSRKDLQVVHLSYKLPKVVGSHHNEICFVEQWGNKESRTHSMRLLYLLHTYERRMQKEMMEISLQNSSRVGTCFSFQMRFTSTLLGDFLIWIMKVYKEWNTKGG